MQEKKYNLTVDEHEHRLLIYTLNDERTALMAQGHSTDAVDDLMIKIYHAPEKRPGILRRSGRRRDPER